MRVNKKLVSVVAGLALFCPLILSHHVNAHAEITPFEYEQQLKNDDENFDNQLRFQDYADRANEQAQDEYDNDTPAQKRAWREATEEMNIKSQKEYEKSQQRQAEEQSMFSSEDSEDNKENRGLWSHYIQDGGNISTTQSPDTNTSIREEAYTPTDSINNNYVTYNSDGSVGTIEEPYWPDDSRAVIPSDAKLNTMNCSNNSQQTTWGNTYDDNDTLYYVGDGLWANENDMLSLRRNYNLDIPATDDGLSHTINGSQLPGEINLSEDTPANASITPYETSLMDKADGVNYAPTDTSVPTSTVLSMSPASSSYSQPSSVSTSSDSSDNDQDGISDNASDEDDDDINNDSSENEGLDKDLVKSHKHHANKKSRKHYNKSINYKATQRTNIAKQITLNKKFIKNDRKYLSTRRAKRFIKRYNFATKFINHHKRSKRAKRLMKKVMRIRGVKHYLYYYKDEIRHEKDLTRLTKRINKKHVRKNRKHVKRSHKVTRHHRKIRK